MIINIVMKKRIFKSLLIACLLTGSFISCSDDDESTPVNHDSNLNAVANIAKNGTWRITSFIDSATDETGHYTKYHFTLGYNDVSTATEITSEYGYYT